MIQHGKYFFMEYEGEEYRGKYIDVGWSFTELLVEKRSSKPIRKFFIGPLVYTWKMIKSAKDTMWRKDYYTIESTKSLMIKCINYNQTHKHIERIEENKNTIRI
jgi:hypothetical protein